MITHRNFYINGAWTAPAKARDYPVIDPATEEQVAVISLGDQADTDAAVAVSSILHLLLCLFLSLLFSV